MRQTKRLLQLCKVRENFEEDCSWYMKSVNVFALCRLLFPCRRERTQACSSECMINLADFTD